MRIIAGEWRGRRIQAPRGEATRPTTDRVREAWMSAVQPELPGARVLDLFAGSGALGLEALSRGARHCTFVENGPAALRALRANLDLLGATTSARIARADALRFVAELGAAEYDVAFADPPYGKGIADVLLRRWLEAPFARTLCVEHHRHDAMPDLPEARQRRYGDTVLTFVTTP